MHRFSFGFPSGSLNPAVIREPHRFPHCFALKNQPHPVIGLPALRIETQTGNLKHASFSDRAFPTGSRKHPIRYDSDGNFRHYRQNDCFGFPASSVASRHSEPPGQGWLALIANLHA